MMRRKHHCRMCGQIFDNKCTTLLSGSYFDMPSSVRICKTCEVQITSQDDESSDYSDDASQHDLSARPHTPDFSAARYDDDNVSIMSHSLEHMAKPPVMNLPVRRAYDDSNRASAILEFDAQDHNLSRPSSSRSLRTVHSLSHGHKRHHSKHAHGRGFKQYHDDRVPFQKQTVDDLKAVKTSAFHRDSVIDPELAQYLSDEASSDDDQPPLHSSRSSEKLSRSGPDNDRSTIGGLLAAVRKGRSRAGDRNIAGFLNLANKDADDAASIVSARAVEGPRSSRKRNLSVASSVHQKMTPRSTKERLQVALQPGPDLEPPASPALRSCRVMRSASMHGLGAPQLELNRASIQHVHRLLRQLLQNADIPKVSSWEDALIPIFLKVTDEVDPDIDGGDDIDIRKYVKLKKIPGGKPADTSYVSGLIFTKNVALKSMQRSIARPRILIITFPLEYTRSESHFMSLDPVLRQEREYLQNVVSRVANLKPDVLFAQRNVSGLALELLEKAEIAVAYNVKPEVIQAVARNTFTPVVHSPDKLAGPPEMLGTCELFQVKTYLTEGRRKTFIYLSGCPPELGCTIALKGASRNTLSKIKHIAAFMVYVVYNLKLETCLMRDEWAWIPSNVDDLKRTPTTTAPVKAEKHRREDEAASKMSPQETSATDQHALAKPSENESNLTGSTDVQRLDSQDSADIPDNVPVPTFYQDLADKHETRILSASPFVKFSQPYLLMRARELERRVAYLKWLRDQDLSDSASLDEKSKIQKFTLITPEMVHSPPEAASRKIREIIQAVHEAEYDKALHYYETQKRGWEAHLDWDRNLFDPYAHQRISVLFSIVSTSTHIPCHSPKIVTFAFYDESGNDTDLNPDSTLKQFVEDQCYRANDPCPGGVCDKKMFEHQRHYEHGEAQITIFVEPHPPKLRGLQDVILMWSICRICGTETTVTPMSESTAKYSFGKYLELSFWSADLHARAGCCSHDLHRDHLRYFGFMGYAVRVHYDPIDLLEVIVPRMRITWKVDQDLRFRNDVYTKVEHRITRFMVSVKLRLKGINIEAILPESADACRNEIERLTKQANDDHSALIKKLQELYTNSQHWEILPLNRALKALAEKADEWEQAFNDFEKNFFPSEKDIRRLATLQLKKIFLDRDVSITSIASSDDQHTHEPELHDDTAASPESPKSVRKLSPEKTQNVLQAVMEEHVGGSPHSNEQYPQQGDEISTTAAVALTPARSAEEDIKRASVELDHLDLALPEPSPKSSIPSVDAEPALGPVAAFPTPAKVVVHQSLRPEGEARRSDAAKSPGESQTSAIEINRTATPVQSLVPPLISQASEGSILTRSSSPLLPRTRSQPAGSLPQRKDFIHPPKHTPASTLHAVSGFGSGVDRRQNDTQQETPEKKLSERLGLSRLKNQRLKGQSLIPRAISGGRKESRVSNLAKHFEQLTREFEQARLRERQQRQSRPRRSQIYPTTTSRPTVEVYQDTNAAVEEIHDLEIRKDQSNDSAADSLAETTPQALGDSDEIYGQLKKLHTDAPPSTHTETDDSQDPSQSYPTSEAGDRAEVDEEEEMADDGIVLPDNAEDLVRLTQEDLELDHLPKHERTSLIKLLTNFWAERSSSGWQNLDYPLSIYDHVLPDTDIIVREDEVSSCIAYALDSTEYRKRLQHSEEKVSAPSTGGVHSSEESILEQQAISQALKRPSSTLNFLYQTGPFKLFVRIFFAEQFDAMRKKCGVHERYLESLSRCMKFDSKGGKSKSIFLKTLDDRFVLKSLSPVETQSFVKFAPEYFRVMEETFFHGMPSAIAKMLGFYQVVIKNAETGNDHSYFLLVMENLFYDRTPTRIFDLKGSMRNRKIDATGERNEVLLDENMVDYVFESPLFVREHGKKLLNNSIHNDTKFLRDQNVMDYSLMVAVDEPRKELVIGIIDCIRTYTWDKKLESWIKDRSLMNPVSAAGIKHKPTITSPQQYKRRFREAMKIYVLEVPGAWHLGNSEIITKRETRTERMIKDQVEVADDEQTVG